MLGRAAATTSSPAGAGAVGESCCAIARLSAASLKALLRDYDGRAWENGQGQAIG